MLLHNIFLKMTRESGNLVIVNGKVIPIMFCALCEEGTKDSALIT